jgi:hypothetical protein
MHQVGLEPTIPVFECAKTVHALLHATTVITQLNVCMHILWVLMLIGILPVNYIPISQAVT